MIFLLTLLPTALATIQLSHFRIGGQKRFHFGQGFVDDNFAICFNCTDHDKSNNKIVAVDLFSQPHVVFRTTKCKILNPVAQTIKTEELINKTKGFLTAGELPEGVPYITINGTKLPEQVIYATGKWTCSKVTDMDLGYPFYLTRNISQAIVTPTPCITQPTQQAATCPPCLSCEPCVCDTKQEPPKCSFPSTLEIILLITTAVLLLYITVNTVKHAPPKFNYY